jgi:chromosomal replication initiation ATPase DnaA
MKASQIPLNFSFRSANGREDFLVASPNKDAVEWIDKWPNWPDGFLLLKGPVGCGKSHLASVWQKMSGAVSISMDDLNGMSIQEMTEISTNAVLFEDVDETVPEREMFHLFNLFAENRKSMLVTAEISPAHWRLKLPDLASRLGTIPVAEIKEPDDQLFSALVIKQFSDRQLAVTPEVVQYLLHRIERSFAEIKRIVTIVDNRALAKKKKISLTLLREILKEEQGY